MDLTELHASKTVAFKVRERRVTLRWSRRELAERSGLAEQAITDIELMRRQRGITVDELMTLAAGLRIDPAVMLPPLTDYFQDAEQRARAEDLVAKATVLLMAEEAKLSKAVDEIRSTQEMIIKLRNMISSAQQGRV